jgi:hypothetical protein
MKKAAHLSAILLLAALIIPLMFFSIHNYKALAAPNGHGNVYVDASRPNDSGDGLSWATAMKSIDSAIDLVDPDGTVHVAAGTYRENLHLDKFFNLVGAGAPVTIIDGGGVGQVIRVSSADGQINTISGFTIQNGNVGGSGPAQEGTLGGGMPVGGGVYVAMHHTVIMNDCTIENNTTSFLGGGIYNAGRLYLNRCTISDNRAGMVGGGIANFSDESEVAFITLTNCTVSGNRVTGVSGVLSEGGDGPAQFVMVAPSIGGGVFNGGDAEFWNVTIANNSVPSNPASHGGGIANVPLQCTNDSKVTIGSPVKNRAMYKNTIVANNVPDNGYNDVETNVLSLGNNIDSQNNCEFNDTSDQVNTNPLLGPLQDNGGPTPTMAMCTNSPAFNRGDNSSHSSMPLDAGIHETGIPDIDQRGIARPQVGIYDIGAFELVPLTVSTLDATGVALNTTTLNGNLTSGASTLNSARVFFQYGSSSGMYTGETAVQILTSPGPFSAAVTLPFGVNYFRAVADCTFGREKSVALFPPLQTSGGSNSSTGTGGSSTVGLPGITVVSASLSTFKTAPGAPVTVTASVANRGTANGTVAVKLYVNGQEESSRGVTVNSGSNVPVSFTVNRDEPGTYAVYVGGVSAGSFTVDGLMDPNIVLYASIVLIVGALIACVFYVRRKPLRD